MYVLKELLRGYSAETAAEITWLVETADAELPALEGEILIEEEGTLPEDALMAKEAIAVMSLRRSDVKRRQRMAQALSKGLTVTEVAAIDRSSVQIVENIVNTMPAKNMRQAQFVALLLKGYNQSEISEILGVEPKKVAARMRQLKKYSDVL